MNKIPLVVIVGPTATGKTKLAIELAKLKNGEIISADSMQVYKGLDIGTAKPSKNEIQAIKHHMIDIKDVLEDFSVAAYCNMAHGIIRDINNSGKLSFLVGGTGLYIDSLVNNIKFCDNIVDEGLRKELYSKLETHGISYLINELSKFDPITAKQMHEKNPKRVIRAIEIYKTTGIPMSKHVENSRNEPSPYDACFIGLNYRNRDLLYDKINKRVDQMISDGLLNEARYLLKLSDENSEKNITSIEAIGYKEIFPYLRGECTLLEATESLKQSSRRYAKRQITWFKRNDKINWIYIDDYSNFNDVLKSALDIINKK